MHMREVAKRMSVNEFTTICSWLDYNYGRSARTFEVISLERIKSGHLIAVDVVLADKKVLHITPEMIDKTDAKRRETEPQYARKA
jgi:hypothetical protein